MEYDPSIGGYLRLLTVLSVRAVRCHPGGLDDCTCLCLRRPCWLHLNWQVGHPRTSSRGRNRFTLAHYGSYRAPLWASPRRLSGRSAKSATCLTGISHGRILSSNKNGQACPDAPIDIK
jgi:hypothetical protein